MTKGLDDTGDSAERGQPRRSFKATEAAQDLLDDLKTQRDDAQERLASFQNQLSGQAEVLLRRNDALHKEVRDLDNRLVREEASNKVSSVYGGLSVVAQVFLGSLVAFGFYLLSQQQEGTDTWTVDIVWGFCVVVFVLVIVLQVIGARGRRRVKASDSHPRAQMPHKAKQMQEWIDGES